ncbi:MAG: hypothetical protein U0746_10330 [Gemmataceae bacterium]
MPPRLRKFALAAHVTSSVGWFGAVAGFLTLAVAGLTSQNDQKVRAAYLAMELTAWFVIVPLSLASPLTGLVQSLGTAWGLFRHYWVVAKLLITIPASLVLLLHMQPIARVASTAAETTLSGADLRGLRIQLVANAGAALLVLLVATTLSVYKPWGRTGYGRRKHQERGGTGDGTRVRPVRSTAGTPRRVYVLGGVVVLVLLLVVLHLAGLGLGGHAP